MDERDVIDGRWKVVGQVDYSGPEKTGRENWAEAGRRLGRLVHWILTAAIVYGVVSCTRLIVGS